jgi:hypothetical protein
MCTSGRGIAHPRFGDPHLAWTVDFWDNMTAPYDASADLNDLNILSNLRNQVSNKKAKLTHAITEVIVGYGDKLEVVLPTIFCSAICWCWALI